MMLETWLRNQVKSLVWTTPCASHILCISDIKCLLLATLNIDIEFQNTRASRSIIFNKTILAGLFHKDHFINISQSYYVGLSSVSCYVAPDKQTCPVFLEDTPLESNRNVGWRQKWFVILCKYCRVASMLSEAKTYNETPKLTPYTQKVNQKKHDCPTFNRNHLGTFTKNANVFFCRRVNGPTAGFGFGNSSGICAIRFSAHKCFIRI